MDTPRLLAVDDIRVAAPPDAAAGVAEFYTTVVGLRLLRPRPEEPALVFAGCSAVKPKLVISLAEEHPEKLRGHVPVQVASLSAVQQIAEERGLETAWSRRLSFFDRRLTILDPAGNRVELTTYHML